MADLEIRRWLNKQEYTISGLVLQPGNIPLSLSFELPPKDNQANISCLPDGEFDAIRLSPRSSTLRASISKAWGSKRTDTFCLIGVPGREGAMFHPGVVLKHTHGCPIPATSVDATATEVNAKGSGAAFKKLMLCFEGRDRIRIKIMTMKPVKI